METETTEVRRARMLHMKTVKKMTLAEIGQKEGGLSKGRVQQIIGGTRFVLAPSSRHLELYRFIEKYQSAHHYSPSFRELVEAFPTDQGRARSTAVMRYWLMQMEKLAFIEERPAGLPRVIVLKKLNTRNPQIAALLEQEKTHE